MVEERAWYAEDFYHPTIISEITSQDISSSESFQVQTKRPLIKHEFSDSVSDNPRHGEVKRCREATVKGKINQNNL